MLRWTDPTGVVMLPEMAVMLEARRGGHAGGGRAPSHGCHYVLVLVDGVDEHFQRAHPAGARIIAEPEGKPWGLRQYLVEDLDGHRWESRSTSVTGRRTGAATPA